MSRCKRCGGSLNSGVRCNICGKDNQPKGQSSSVENQSPSDKNCEGKWHPLDREKAVGEEWICECGAYHPSLCKIKSTVSSTAAPQSSYEPLTRLQIEKERVCFQAFSTDADQAKRLTTLCDMATNAILFSQEIDRLRSVPVSATATPEGWKLVPMEPTWEMLNHGFSVAGLQGVPFKACKTLYQAMLTACTILPQPEAGARREGQKKGFCILDKTGKMYWGEGCISSEETELEGDLECLQHDTPDDGWHIAPFYASPLDDVPVGRTVKTMCDSGDMPKKPRLFYYEEAENAWLPASLAIESNFADAELSMLDNGEVREIQIKRVDMTDAEYNSMPDD